MKSAKIVKISTGYVPRPGQALIHKKLKRFNVLVCHRRFGKTVFAVNEMIDKGLKCKHRNPQVAYLAPTYKQAKMIVWEYLLDYTKNLPNVEINKSELTVTVNRGEDKVKFFLLGADNPDALRGLYLDGAVLDEYAQMAPIVWSEIIRPALSDRTGWAIFIGTPKGKNHFYDRYRKAQGNENWYTALIKASESKVLNTRELLDMKLDMNAEEYAQELECDWTATLQGAYYAKYLKTARAEGRIGEFPWDPSYPVETFWDLGISDAMTIWFRQKIDDKWYYIDYYENDGEGLEHYMKVLNLKPYAYGRHILPHDANVRELTTGNTRIESIRKMGLKRVEVQEKQAVGDRIHASRQRIAISYFDGVKCVRGLECLESYQREWDSKQQAFKDKPKHDWASHGADSFGYSALDSRASEDFEDNINPSRFPHVADNEYDEFGV
jgi:hypothetical protein